MADMSFTKKKMPWLMKRKARTHNYNEEQTVGTEIAGSRIILNRDKL